MTVTALDHPASHLYRDPSSLRFIGKYHGDSHFMKDCEPLVAEEMAQGLVVPLRNVRFTLPAFEAKAPTVTCDHIRRAVPRGEAPDAADHPNVVQRTAKRVGDDWQFTVVFYKKKDTRLVS